MLRYKWKSLNTSDESGVNKSVDMKMTDDENIPWSVMFGFLHDNVISFKVIAQTNA